VLNFKEQLIQAALLSPRVSDAQFIQWFDWTGLQRHLKNLGIFTRLHHRDGKSGYLGDIPLLLGYIAATCRLYVELKPLEDFFKALEEPRKSCAL
jgi:aminoglycoside/choline kinase family phosphotransferase